MRRKALGGAGLLASYQGDYALGEAYLREALAVAEQDGDDEARAMILNWLGTNAYGGGELDEAETYIAESVAIRRRLGDSAGIATALNALGGVYHFRGDLDRAREMFAESLVLKQELGNPNGIAVRSPTSASWSATRGGPTRRRRRSRRRSRSGSGPATGSGSPSASTTRRCVALDLGRYDEAAEMLQRSYDIARELGDRTELAYALADRVRVEVERGNLDVAASALAQGLPRVVASGVRVIIPLLLEGAGCLAAARERGPRGRAAVGRRDGGADELAAS